MKSMISFLKIFYDIKSREEQQVMREVVSDTPHSDLKLDLAG